MTSSQTVAVDYKALPKIELHTHLSDSISRQCLHEIWLIKKGAGETSLQDPLVEMPLGKHDYDLKTHARLSSPLFSSYIYNLINDVATLRYATLSVLRDFAADGVVYLELRTTPRAMPGTGLTEADYVQTILDAIEEFDVPGAFARQTLPRPRRCRHRPLRQPGRWIRRWVPIFEEARRIPGLGMTLHFAEAECSATDAELDMLLGWRPDRIGHVIHVSDRVKKNIVRRSGLALELCLSCNVHAGMIHGGFESQYSLWGVVEAEKTVVVLSTDDVGVFGSPLSNEYALVARHFGLN
ncbi:uncharacterized protein B0T15DRAFT_505366 [Chaetomium strumarium]|uniref:Adenosine deaminase domain-containing protein n=1 Tax=Chaetomium strumarium TaxID=1170767 RepID=A0AAJ0GLT4_9PEZI|nr:hypothetical protein B0T15DRAFT_505366 [Chaetomium strumarium]